MSSSTRCDAVSVCLLSYTRIAIILVLVFVLVMKIALRDMTWLQPNRKITILDKLAVNATVWGGGLFRLPEDHLSIIIKG